MPFTPARSKLSPKTELHTALKEKLCPCRFPDMSGQMAAVVGFVIGANFTEPQIAEMVVTPDGLVLARNEGDLEWGHITRHYEDLLQNWFAILGMAGLTRMERNEAESLFAVKIEYLRQDA